MPAIATSCTWLPPWRRAVALDAYVECAKACIQVLGGMGFTWEHDAHLHLRRAMSLRQLLGDGTPSRIAASTSALGGLRRTADSDLPVDADGIRTMIRPLVEQVAALDDKGQRRRRLAELGLIMPHWPAPYGRDAGAVEQLVIDQELAAAHVRRPHLGVGAWALPTIIVHGSDEQRRRWVEPTLEGGLRWCQLFSEPGAGSDLASLSTRATKAPGGWVIDGQKVWTSMAAGADYGICLARTDPDAPRHDGITYFVVDMASEGIDVRPLRELTGAALFNEVFLTGVFVADDCVVGPVHGGWRLARTTLDNERVSMSSGSVFGWGIEAVLGWLSGRPQPGRRPGGARPAGRPARGGPLARHAGRAGHAAVRVGRRPRSRGQHPQAARRRARAARPGAGARPPRPGGGHHRG